MNLNNQIVNEIASKLEFDLVGFAEYCLLDKETILLEKWVSNGYNAGMQYMANNFDKKCDIRKILPSAKSVISLGLNYYKKDDYKTKQGTGKVSKYAWGTDYHYIIWDKLELFINDLKSIDPSVEAISYVDTGPVMDKIWAEKAGLGWLGKNSNLINKRIGSWFFIANIIINKEFDYHKVVHDHCGSCKACIEVCPTDAILEGRQIDANKCISYLTIENKDEISNDFIGKFDDWIFGCDLCQDVCPWNKKNQVETSISDFKDESNKELFFDEIKTLSNSEFKKRYGKSPIFRAKNRGLKRNAEFLAKTTPSSKTS